MALDTAPEDLNELVESIAFGILAKLALGPAFGVAPEDLTELIALKESVMLTEFGVLVELALEDLSELVVTKEFIGAMGFACLVELVAEKESVAATELAAGGKLSDVVELAV